MTCRCKTPAEHSARYAQNRADSERWTEAEVAHRLTELSERTPNPDEFRIVDYEQVDKHLVLKVRYPSCKRCSFDQCKVMVFLNETLKNALRWTRIDPHFQEKVVGAVPSPAARFPASAEGWSDAVAYAGSKGQR